MSTTGARARGTGVRVQETNGIVSHSNPFFFFFFFFCVCVCVCNLLSQAHPVAPAHTPLALCVHAHPHSRPFLARLLDCAHVKRLARGPKQFQAADLGGVHAAGVGQDHDREGRHALEAGRLQRDEAAQRI